MIAVENVWKAFGDNTVLKGVSFKLERGEFVGLVGPSGAGKSVLLKLLAHVVDPDFGDVYATEEGQAEHRHPSVGFLFQEGALFDSMTVLENVYFPLTAGRGLSDRDYDSILRQAYDILAEVGLAAAYNKLPGQLSGGMRRRVGIARALVSRPELVLLDDPTGGLDPVAASVIMKLIKKLHRLYRPTVVIVSHDIRRLLPSVSRVLALFEGQIVCDLEPLGIKDRAPKDVYSFLATRFDFESFHSLR